MPAGDAARVTDANNQAIVTATWTTVTFDSEVRDDATFHSTSSNTGRLTMPASGWFLIGYHINFANDGNTPTGDRQCRIILNGGTDPIQQFGQPAVAVSSNTQLTGTVLANLNNNDYVEVQAFQDRGTNLNIITANTELIFWVLRI